MQSKIQDRCQMDWEGNWPTIAPVKSHCKDFQFTSGAYEYVLAFLKSEEAAADMVVALAKEGRLDLLATLEQFRQGKEFDAAKFDELLGWGHFWGG